MISVKTYLYYQCPSGDGEYLENECKGKKHSNIYGVISELDLYL